MCNQQTDTQRLHQLVQKYVELNTDEYRRAKKLVSDHAIIQESIKKIMKEKRMTEFHTETDKLKIDLSFTIRIREAVDTMIIPDEIKEQYKKLVETCIENLVVKIRL